MSPTFTDDIKQAVETLRNGGVIIYPTDTIWGIGCDATNAKAVARIYEIKQREASKSMIVLFDSVGRASQYIDAIPDVAYDLIELADKPTTLILDNPKNIAPNLVAEDNTIAIRVTAEEYSRELCARLRKPLVSTSVNISGRTAAATFADIDPGIIKQADYVAHYRRTDQTPHKPSSIIKLAANGTVKIIRE